MAKSYAKISDVSMPNLVTLYDGLALVRTCQIDLISMALPGVDSDRFHRLAEEIKEEFVKFDALMKVYEAIPFSEGEKEIYDIVSSKAEILKKDFDKILPLLKKTTDQASSERKEALDLINKDLTIHADEYEKELDILLRFHEKIADVSIKQAKNYENEGIFWSLLIIVLSTAFGMGVTFVFAKSLVHSFEKINHLLSESSKELGQEATKIAASSEQLHQSTTEQAASVQETSASVEEMSSMVTKNSENAKQSSDISFTSQRTAEKGQRVVEQMIQAIGEINTSNNQIMEEINESNRQIEGIVQVITEIGNKTKVINDIVFQTKLLSFNASVEAARAGEHGKGFAVVAEEVGNLAQMSGNAAKEISEMLNGSINKVEEIVKESKSKIGTLIIQGKNKVEVGNRVAKECNEVLVEIVNSVEKVAQMSAEISTASEEQSKGVHEITKAISNIDQVTQQNASSSQETATAAEQLSFQSEKISKIVNSLSHLIEGGSAELHLEEELSKKHVSQFSNATKVFDFKNEKQKRKPEHKVEEKKKFSMKVKKSNSTNATHSEEPQKMAAGAEPSFNDPRFQDV
jgi:methyl-accepting chemotaxis protein